MSADRFVIHKSLFSLVLLILLGTLAYFPLFTNLGKFQIRMWDEATYANNSIDMMGSSNIFVVEHLGKEDPYNTKPPFVIWMQAISMKLFGINEFAVRLPSAIFGFLTVLLVYIFSIRVLGSRLIGFLSAVVLLCSGGFASNHVVRTGDLDAALVFWLSLGLFTYIDLLIKKPKNSLFHFLIVTTSLICGFLTKGIAGFFFIPFMFIASMFFNNRKIFKDKYLYISVVVTALFCSGYYLMRELHNPGYIDSMLVSEIFRYNSAVMSWHIHPFDYYYQNLKTDNFYPFLYFLPLTLISLLILRSAKLQVTICLAIAAVGYFLLISYPPVKLEWYDAPLFPILSVLTGLAYVETGMFIFRKLNIRWEPYKIKFILATAALLFLYKPYRRILETVKYPEEQIYSMELDGAYLKYLIESKPEIKNITVFKKEGHEEHYDQVLFYIRAYEKQQNYHIRLKKEMDFQQGEIVMVCKAEDKEKLQQKYLIRELDRWRDAFLFQVISKNFPAI